MRQGQSPLQESPLSNTTLVVSVLFILSPDIIWSKSNSLHSNWSLVQDNPASRMRLFAAAAACISERLSVAPGNGKNQGKAAFLPADVGGGFLGRGLRVRRPLSGRASWAVTFPRGGSSFQKPYRHFGGWKGNQRPSQHRDVLFREYHTGDREQCSETASCLPESNGPTETPAPLFLAHELMSTLKFLCKKCSDADFNYRELPL